MVSEGIPDLESFRIDCLDNTVRILLRIRVSKLGIDDAPDEYGLG